MTWSRTWAVADLLKSSAIIALAGLVTGRTKAKSRSLSRRTMSAGNSVPSSSRSFTSLNSVSILNFMSSSDMPAIMLWSMSPGSQEESASTVRPDGSMTVPVTSCLDSFAWPPIPGSENFILTTTCTVTTARWFFLKISRPLSANSSARHSEAKLASSDMMLMTPRVRVWCIGARLPDSSGFPVRFKFQIQGVDAAKDFQYHHRLSFRGDLLQCSPESVHVLNGLALHLENQITDVK